MTELSPSSTDNVITDTVTSQRAVSSKLSQTLTQSDGLRRLDRRTASLRERLAQADMVASLSAVATEHSLSAPLVAAFHATPGFEQAVQNFPAANLYDVYPEHNNSANNIAGLESFGAAQSAAVDLIRTSATDVVAAFTNVLSLSGNTIAVLQKQIAADRLALEASDVTDDVLETLQVTSVADTTYNQTFILLQDLLQTVEPFNTDTLRAFPQNIKDEVEGLESLITQAGPTLGLEMSDYGLQETDRGEATQSTTGTFSDLGLTKAGLIFHLDQASAVLEKAAEITARHEEMAAALNEEVSTMPTQLNGDDVTFGASDQCRFLMSHTKLTTALVNESILMASTLLTAVDAALDIDAGIDA